MTRFLEGVIYFKGFIVRNDDGGFTNHLLIRVVDMVDLDGILQEYGLGIRDITIIDFR